MNTTQTEQDLVFEVCAKLGNIINVDNIVRWKHIVEDARERMLGFPVDSTDARNTHPVMRAAAAWLYRHVCGKLDYHKAYDGCCRYVDEHEEGDPVRAICRSGLQVQDACNLVGVLRSMLQDVGTLADQSEDFSYAARHPAIRLYAEQVCHLAGIFQEYDANNALKTYEIIVSDPETVRGRLQGIIDEGNWLALYRNEDLGHPEVGRIIAFPMDDTEMVWARGTVRAGKPATAPDGDGWGLGWRYVFQECVRSLLKVKITAA